MPKIYEKIDIKDEQNKEKKNETTKKNTSGKVRTSGKKTAVSKSKENAAAGATSGRKNGKAASAKMPEAETAKESTGKKKETSADKKKTSGAADDNKNKSKNKSSASKNKITSDSVLRITSLGGLEEIGKNMTLFECEDDAVIVDCGMAFPDDDLLGVDAVIPDFTYLESIKDKLRGLVVTHGHEDHIGGIPFLLQQFHIPIYATPLTIGLIGSKLSEAGLLEVAQLNTVKTGNSITIGCFSIEFIRVNHSIPDAAALAITTPAGVIVHTGDFKIDYTPVFGETADLGRLSEYGEKGVLALLCDSTNAERPGNSVSESNVGASF